MGAGSANQPKEAFFVDAEHAPGGILVYYADGGEEIIYANRHTIALVGCDGFADFMAHTKGSFRGFVHEDDIEAVEEAIWSQVEERDGLDHVFYRIRTKSGDVLSIDDYGRLVQKIDERPVFYVFLAIVERQDARDWLTALPELAHFKHRAEVETRDLTKFNAAPAILAFDIMGMKNYNATYGRKSGDVLLRGFADVLRAHFDSDACCRHAGDRFFVFTVQDDMEEAIEAVFSDFARLGLEGVPPVMGGACSFYPGDDVSSVLDRARFACDSDSTTWESHISWFTEGMRSDATLRAYVLDHLDQAVANRWIRPFYQAIMRSSTGCVCCEEALARWVDPTHGTLAPDVFIPVLERAGLMRKLDMHMVDCVLEDMAAKRASGTPIVPVSVNVSLDDFEKLDVAQEIAKRADAHGIEHSLLKVEFTESMASDNPELLRNQIAALHRAGFDVWADDFGSGYSSLNTLGQFQFDLIKLDMEFVRNLGNERCRAIVEGIVKVASKLGLDTLSEGVETAQQARILKEMGCDMLQGFYYAKPLPLDTIIDHFHDGLGFVREDVEEASYWKTVGTFDLDNPVSNDESWAADGAWLKDFPAAVSECRDGGWDLVRTNREYWQFLWKNEVNQDESGEVETKLSPDEMDGDFLRAIERCRESEEWERVAGRLEYGTGLQFYTKRITQTDKAEAFAIASVPAMLGATLGSYGDVPVAYAVFRVVLNDAGDEVIDTEYVYANDKYCSTLGRVQSDLPGRSFMETVGNSSTVWFPYCYRAAVLKEHVHDVVYSPEIEHWVSFNFEPSLVEGCCTFAFTIADDERIERERMLVGLDTSDFIIAMMDAFLTEKSYDVAMNNLLKTMSNAIHPERIYVFERKGATTDNTFEWCAPGVEPQIDTLQQLDNSEFDTWEKLLADNPIVLIPDVAALKGVDDRMYWQLNRQGITHMLAVPLRFEGELVGYLGADNYAFEEGLDTMRMLESAAGLISARIVNRRLLDKLQGA